MSTFSYVLTPLLAWLVAGVIKFIINSIRSQRLAFDLIGYGGLPSNHSAIVSSTLTLVGLREGIQSPAFGVSITLAIIVILDAVSLRRQVGKQASAINILNVLNKRPTLFLRERIGHTQVEILAGSLVGCTVGYVIWYLS